MSWSKSVRWAKAIWSSKVDGQGSGSADAPASADAGLPMGARIGSVLQLPVSPFIRDANSLVGPAPGREQVVAISRIRAELSGAVHRYYTALGDGGDVGGEVFLQVYSEAAGAVLETVYFRRLMRLIPTTAQEQDSFMGANGSGLGEREFSVFRAQIETLANMRGDPLYTQAQLDAVFNGEESITYTRSVDADDEFVEPWRGVENRIDDAMGESGLRQEVVFMLYARELSGGGQEQLLISTEIIQNQNGDASRRAIHVDFMVGLVIDRSAVMVQ